jgi:hypothetical protein
VADVDYTEVCPPLVPTLRRLSVRTVHAPLLSSPSLGVVQDTAEASWRHVCRKCSGRHTQFPEPTVWVAAEGEQAHLNGERWCRPVRVLCRCRSCFPQRGVS